ncbi:MAG: hypothetical protein V4476_09605 [Pseudomonadota bacterium]
MKTLLALSGVLALSGCASVIGEKMQPVLVTTVFDSKEVAGFGCTLSNDAGSWSLTSPASVVVHKSTGDLAIDCKKDAYAGNAAAVSKANGAVWGNILIGGGIGYFVDRSTGAGFNYPSNIVVTVRPLATPAMATSMPLEEIPLKLMSPSQSAARVN